jgi:hypothetical protein
MSDEKTIEWVMWAMRSLRQDHAEITPKKVYEFLRQRAIPLSQDDVGAVLIEISHRRSQWQSMQDHDLNRRLLERLLDEHGLPSSDYTEHFKAEARRLADLIAGGQTVAQAIGTVQDTGLQGALRSFLYPVRLRMAIIVAAGSGGLSEEEAAELHEYLKNL